MSRLPHRGRWLVLLGILLVIGFRLALPFIIKDYVNRRINEIPGYSGHATGVSLSLWRGAYQIHGVTLSKSNGKVPVPLLKVPHIDISLQWRELWHRAAVGELKIIRPQMNFVSGASKEDTQENLPPGWREKVKMLSPFRLNHVQIVDGEVHYRATATDPKVDIYLAHVNASAENLTNTRHIAGRLPARLDATGSAMRRGTFEAHARLDPFAPNATFKIEGRLHNLELTEINDYLRAFGNFDVKAGHLDLVTEVAANDGKYDGYAKPFFKDVDVLRWKQDVKEGKLHAIWQAILAGAATLLKNQETEAVATRVEFSGEFGKKDIDVLEAVANLLKNAFVQALVPNFEHSIKLPSKRRPS